MIPAHETPRAGDLLALLGEAIRLAAREARADVVAELAGIVARRSGEERQRVNTERGVVRLAPRSRKK